MSGHKSNGCLVEGTPIAVDTWLPSLLAGKHHVHFLTHFHSDHIVGLKQSWKYPINCSAITKMFLVEQLGIRTSLINVLYEDSPTVVSLVGTPETNDMAETRDRSDLTMTVTTMDSNHCPGSVMFLFEGYFGRVLATGDFRLSPAHLQLRSPIDRLYVDNTYCEQSLKIPAREECVQKIFDLVRGEPDSEIVLAVSGNLGKEKLLERLAQRTGRKVIVAKKRLELSQLLVRVGYVKAGVFSSEREDRSKSITVIDKHSLSKFPARSKRGVPNLFIIASALVEESQRYHCIPYTDHASFDEITQLVKALKPKRVYPIVKYSVHNRGPYDADWSHRSDMSVFNSLLRTGGRPRRGGNESTNNTEVDIVRAMPEAVRAFMANGVDSSRGSSRHSHSSKESLPSSDRGKNSTISPKPRNIKSGATSSVLSRQRLEDRHRRGFMARARTKGVTYGTEENNSSTQLSDEDGMHGTRSDVLSLTHGSQEQRRKRPLPGKDREHDTSPSKRTRTRPSADDGDNPGEGGISPQRNFGDCRLRRSPRKTSLANNKVSENGECQNVRQEVGTAAELAVVTPALPSPSRTGKKAQESPSGRHSNSSRLPAELGTPPSDYLSAVEEVMSHQSSRVLRTSPRKTDRVQSKSETAVGVGRLRSEPAESHRVSSPSKGIRRHKRIDGSHDRHSSSHKKRIATGKNSSVLSKETRRSVTKTSLTTRTSLVDRPQELEHVISCEEQQSTSQNQQKASVRTTVPGKLSTCGQQVVPGNLSACGRSPGNDLSTSIFASDVLLDGFDTDEDSVDDENMNFRVDTSRILIRMMEAIRARSDSESEGAELVQQPDETRRSPVVICSRLGATDMAQGKVDRERGRDGKEDDNGDDAVGNGSQGNGNLVIEGNKTRAKPNAKCDKPGGRNRSRKGVSRGGSLGKGVSHDDMVRGGRKSESERTKRMQKRERAHDNDDGSSGSDAKDDGSDAEDDGSGGSDGHDCGENRLVTHKTEEFISEALAMCIPNHRSLSEVTVSLYRMLPALREFVQEDETGS